MAFISNLEERFLENVKDLYSEQPKESADLNPIIYYKPDDPNRPQGSGGSNRFAPVEAVLRDQERMTKWLTSSKGLLWLGKQAVLQTGNVISETRILNPLFINLNLSPTIHIKRQLFDQSDIVVIDPDRSPGSTPDIGLAGRLQHQTGADALYRVMGSSTARSSLIDVLSATQLAGTVTGIFQFRDGTYQVNQRPELDIQGRYYASILYMGRKPEINKGLEFVTDALGAVGLAGGIIGLPNIFAGIRGSSPLPKTANFSLTGPDPLGAMPYFDRLMPGIGPEVQRYLTIIPSIQKTFGISTLIGISAFMPKVIGISLATVANNLFGGLGFGSFTSFSSISTFSPTISIGPDPATILTSTRVSGQTAEDDLLSAPDRSLKIRYQDPDANQTALSNTSRELIQHTKDEWATDQAAWLRSYWDDQYRGALIRRGIDHGITMENRHRFREGKNYQEFREVLTTLPGDITEKGKLIRYYHDKLNMVIEKDGPKKLSERTDGDADSNPKDYINVSFYSIYHDRMIPFRAMITNINESITPEYNSDRYLGRIERNIVYQGTTRNLSFTLFVHAFSPDELNPIWRKINWLTSLTYPANTTSDGYLIPPIVELSIGNVYLDQPGWIANVVHTIPDDTSWEINEGQQLPMTVEIAITFEVIEKKTMQTLSDFYGDNPVGVK